MRFKNPNRKDETLKELLIEKGVFTEEEFKAKRRGKKK